MKVAYSRRSLDDLRKIIAHCRRDFGDRAALMLLKRIEAAVARIGEAPESAPRVGQRPGIHALSLVRYPYRIFYRVDSETVTIPHIRHRSRRPWPVRDESS